MKFTIASLLSLTALALSMPAHGQALPEYLLHFHGNTHEGTPPCTGNGVSDAATCGGPFLTTAALDTVGAASFVDNPLLVTTNGRGAGDPNWTWRPTAATTIQDLLVVQFWGACNATCVALGGAWDVALWKNGVKVHEFLEQSATPATPDVPSLLTLTVRLPSPIVLNGTTDLLSLVVSGFFSDSNSRIYYDSQSACPGDTSGAPCDSTAIFNARDTDGDGVPDVIDECDNPATVAVDEKGCPAQAACAAAASANATSGVPVSGNTFVDAAVWSDWRILRPEARYGAFVHFFRQGTRAQQNLLLSAAGLKVQHDFRRYTTSVFVEGPVAAFQGLVGHPWVRYVEHNAPLKYLDATQSWTTRVRMAQETVSSGPYFDATGQKLTGKGVTLGIIDGGLFGAHPDFTGRINHNFKLLSPIGGPATYRDVGYADSENGGGGHGTHVTGIVSGDGRQSDGTYPVADVAPFLPGTFTSASPDSKIIHWGHGAAIVVLSTDLAYQHILDNLATPGFANLRAVNNSYGQAGGTPYNPNTTGAQLIRKVVECGVTMVFAASNDGGDGSEDLTSPTCKDPTPGVICVASYNDEGTGNLNGPLSTFSSRGKKGDPINYPDIAAPGDLSTSACAQATPTQAICTGGDDNAAETEWQPWYGTISGTSMASPNITGVIGVLTQAEPSLTPPQIEKLMQRTARKVGDGYEADPQHDGSTIHFGYGAGLVDIQAALEDLIASGSPITKAGARPSDEEWTVIAGDSDPVVEGAADAVQLTMQNLNLDGVTGVMYRLTLADATDFLAPELLYRVESNVRGVPVKTTLRATATQVVAADPGPANNAVATLVVREGNLVRFFVPYSQMAYPPIDEPIHNIRVVVENAGGALDYAPSPANGTVQTAAVQPMYGRAFTTRLSPGVIPPSNERACELPGLTRVTSPGGVTGNGSNTGQDDLRRIWVAEPGDMPGKLVITMKVENLTPAPLSGHRWYVYFNTPSRTDVEAQFVAMDTVAPGGSSATPGFARGYRETIPAPGTSGVGSFTIEGDLPGSSVNPDGTITLVLDKAQFNLQTGMEISSIAGSIRQTSNPDNGAGLTVDSAAAIEGYRLVGNLPCPVVVKPLAVLTADVTSGPAPLTVTFDGSDSTTPAVAGTIVSYTFDFGDGSAPVTQDEPLIEHVYAQPGSYTATLEIRDSENAASTNAAEVGITVLNPPPEVSAGVDFAVNEGAGAMLNAVAADANGDALSYAWTQTGGPVVTIAGANGASASFTAPPVDVDRPLTFRVTVSDGTSQDTDDITVVVRNVATVAPAANALSDNNKVGGGMSGLVLLMLALVGGLRGRRGARFAR